jgi:hypothetical protein
MLFGMRNELRRQSDELLRTDIHTGLRGSGLRATQAHL